MVEYHPSGQYSIDELRAMCSDPAPKVVLMRPSRLAQAADVLTGESIVIHGRSAPAETSSKTSSTILCCPSHYLRFGCGRGRSTCVEEADLFPWEYLSSNWQEVQPLRADVLLRHLPTSVRREASKLDAALERLWALLPGLSGVPRQVLSAPDTVAGVAAALEEVAKATASHRDGRDTMRDAFALARVWGRFAALATSPRVVTLGTDRRPWTLLAYATRAGACALAVCPPDPVSAALDSLQTPGWSGRSFARGALSRRPALLSAWPLLPNIHLQSATSLSPSSPTVVASCGLDAPSFEVANSLIVAGLPRLHDAKAQWLAKLDPLVFGRPVEALIERFNQSLAERKAVGTVCWVSGNLDFELAILLSGRIVTSARRSRDRCA